MTDPQTHSHAATKGHAASFEAARFLLFALCLLALPAYSQDGHSTSPPAVPPPDTISKNAPEPIQDKDARDEVPKRIFWIVPNFMTANDQPENRGPLTSKQKYTIAWHQFADESAHFGNMLQAGISQAADGIPHYGQGWGAFGERFLAEEGDQFTGSFLIYGVLPQVLHQDPRYFRRGTGSPFSRIGYAASRVLIARRDNGQAVFNASQVFGQLGQAGISLSYYAKQDRGVHGLLVGWLVNQTYNIGWNQLKEFTPDLGAYLKRRAQRKRMKQIQEENKKVQASEDNPAPGERRN